MQYVGRWIVELLAAGTFVGALFAGDASFPWWLSSAIAGAAAALSSGIVRATSRTVLRWLLVVALALASVHAAIALSRELAPHPRAIFAAMILLPQCVLLVVATIAAVRSSERLALAGGLAMGAATVFSPWAALAGVVTLAGVLAPRLSREGAHVRDALTTSGAALLAARCTTALAYELACLVAPTDWFLDHWSFYGEPSWRLVLKSSLELATIAASLLVLRGRTTGVLALAIVAPSLAWIADRSRAPFWTSGCVARAHPFSELGGLIALPALVIVLAWSGPLVRALRAPR